ncbi:hypothetical protein QBC46DRAFT_345417 [Diplogelasinospora grovesii]|uniref:Uncharacterized protein n=1 Tax=Diplogelasinospora grovesii TaxID=303347 RepID=A0AAN6S156_9PEZI|nr:hypothetical protein QBC46DRAFT_345417 [Diplogelasinospora grovesii]
MKRLIETQLPAARLAKRRIAVHQYPIDRYGSGTTPSFGSHTSLSTETEQAEDGLATSHSASLSPYHLKTQSTSAFTTSDSLPYPTCAKSGSSSIGDVPTPRKALSNAPRNGRLVTVSAPVEIRHSIAINRTAIAVVVVAASRAGPVVVAASSAAVVVVALSSARLAIKTQLRPAKRAAQEEGQQSRGALFADYRRSSNQRAALTVVNFTASTKSLSLQGPAKWNLLV